MRVAREYKPSILDVSHAVREMYVRSIVGCCLHVVLDDGNIEDSSVEFCIGFAQESGHEA